MKQCVLEAFDMVLREGGTLEFKQESSVLQGEMKEKGENREIWGKY